ncbi:hypothetical protein [Embleya scabrispora]|uniref:hypothetical protein n=1 Tax=Embleya scabrispora TaxID=159449 RepID=UPI0003704DBE|nr:hypothetical protein [Embleya scabrispora]MYS87597.1 hypothetical protein [Streptomyces sp. SID5474]
MRIGITGHRGLTGDLAEQVRGRLRELVELRQSAELVGISCIADGPDAWFARAVLDVGGRIEVVVPASAYRAGLPEWHHDEYDALLGSASQVYETGFRESGEKAHMAGSEILVGLAEHLVAVWDGQPARGYGGTADVVEYARRMGVAVQIVWPEGATRD